MNFRWIRWSTFVKPILQFRTEPISFGEKPNWVTIPMEKVSREYYQEQIDAFYQNERNTTPK